MVDLSFITEALEWRCSPADNWSRGCAALARGAATTWLLAIPISVAAGAAVVMAYHRWAAVRSFSSALSVAALVVPILFLLKPGIRSLVAGQASAAEVAAAPSAARDTSIATPVVLIIFDELPLVSLLDSNRNIDPLLYPNFAALAHDGGGRRSTFSTRSFRITRTTGCRTAS